MFIKKFISVLFIFFALYGAKAQDSAIDIYYQDKISADIKIGKTLIEENEFNEGINYLKNAIKIASERTHDYIASVILINDGAFDPIINYYYKIDSIPQARFYIDLHATLFMRYPESLKRENTITKVQYADYIAACYSITAAKAQNNQDNEYTIKYLELYIENAQNNNLLTEEYDVRSNTLVWAYLHDGQYLKALSLSIVLFKEKKMAGKTDEEAIKMAMTSFSWVNRESRFKPEIIQVAKKACDIWLNFLEPLYEEKGEVYMDSLLMKLDEHDSWREEIIYDMTSTTMTAAMMSRCLHILQIEGYDAAKKSLSDFRETLYKKGKSDIWQIVNFIFLNTLEELKLYSATYSYCKSVENDYMSYKGTFSDEFLYFYIYYFGACNRFGDIRKCIEILEKYFRPVKKTDNLYWMVSRLMGSFYLKIGRLEEGLARMLEALDNYTLPPNPRKGDAISYAGLHSDVGNVYRAMGKTEEAIYYYNKAIAICDQYEMPDQKLSSYFGLGRIYHDKENWDRAREYFLSCAEIQLKTNDWYQESAPFSYLFDIERRNGNVEKARNYLTTMWNSMLNQYLSFRDYLTIQEQTSYWVWNGNISFIGGLVAESSPNYNDIYYNMLLLSKGFLLKAETAEYNNVFESGDRQLEKLYIATHSATEPDREDIESYLALYRMHNFQSELEKSSWKSVQAMLSKQDVAVEFFQYELDDSFKNTQYGAFILKAGWKYPKFIPICSVAKLNIAMKAKQHIYSVEGLLYELIWAPLSKELNGIKNIYYSPIGQLHTLNMAAITDNKGIPMFKTFSMYLLSSTRNIAAITNNAIKKSYVYGGLIYDSDDETMLQEHRKYSQNIDSSTLLRWEADSSYSRLGWSYLPNTKIETDVIAELLKKSNINVTQYSGVTGTEESFKAISGTHPGIIHLATHGFYINYSYVDSLTVVAGNYESRVETSQNALIRSGLILSNGGRAWKGEPIPFGVEDGILQADEIAKLDLSGTSLLVLSACKTALGDISSDGVYGLQRAFKIAGVGTIVMSLWEVDDKATALFMSYFYEALTSGESKHDAFFNAQERLRHQYSDPRYWAAFIMLD